MRKANISKMDHIISKLRAQIDPNSVKHHYGLYKAVKGDALDHLFCEMLNQYDTVLPVTRFKEGTYMFGTTKIVCTMKGNKLVVRPAGGAQMAGEDFFDGWIAKMEEQCKRKNVSELNALHNGQLNTMVHGYHGHTIHGRTF